MNLSFKKITILFLLILIVTNCTPTNYSGKYYYRLNEIQKQLLQEDMSAFCVDIELTVPESPEHRKCISENIKIRDQRLHEEDVARAGAPVTLNTTNTTTNVQN